MSEKIGILGAGGQSDEAESYIDNREIIFHAVTAEFLNDMDGLVDISKPNSELHATKVIAAVGAPLIRKELVEAWGGDNFTNIISPEAYVDKSVRMGVGCLIAPRAVLTTNINIGSHALINVSATVNHDCLIGDYVTISPGAHIGGKVTIGSGAFIGIGATVSNSLNVAPGAVLGAGAVLVNDANVENGVYVGVPAKLLKTNDSWLSEI